MNDTKYCKMNKFHNNIALLFKTFCQLVSNINKSHHLVTVLEFLRLHTGTRYLCPSRPPPFLNSFSRIFSEPQSSETDILPPYGHSSSLTGSLIPFPCLSSTSKYTAVFGHLRNLNLRKRISFRHTGIPRRLHPGDCRCRRQLARDPNPTCRSSTACTGPPACRGSWDACGRRASVREPVLYKEEK